MIKKQGLAELHAAVKQRLAAGTEYNCLDYIPAERTGPFYWIEIAEKIAGETKTGFNEMILFHIHIFPENMEDINVEYEMIQQAEQALTERLPEIAGVTIVTQQYQGMERMTDDTNIERHAVLAYQCRISYGFQTVAETEA